MATSRRSAAETQTFSPTPAILCFLFSYINAVSKNMLLSQKLLWKPLILLNRGQPLAEPTTMNRTERKQPFEQKRQNRND